MAGSKHYVVWVGRKPGVYSAWAECQKQTNGFEGAKFKSFESKAAADSAFRDGWEKHWGKSSGGSKAAGMGTGTGAGASASNRFRTAGRTSSAAQAAEEIDYDSISVDVGTRGNPGPVEYKGVDTRTGEVLFSVGPIPMGTNNLGEFLAIVHALRYTQERGSKSTIYSDSMNAMKWLREKKVATTLARNASTAEIWHLVDEAEAWLRANRYDNKVLKWQTKLWGEIKADYGRK